MRGEGRGVDYDSRRRPGLYSNLGIVYCFDAVNRIFGTLDSIVGLPQIIWAHSTNDIILYMYSNECYNSTLQ